MSNRAARIREIERAIGPRKLVWFGTRGEDASPLLYLRQFAECFSLIAPLGSPAVRDVCLETIRGERVDLDQYSPDLDDSLEAAELHRRLSAAAETPSVIAVYRPTAFATSVCFPRSDTVQYLGVFHELQAAFEHKPWVETELRRAGVRVLPWRYYAADDRQRLAERLARGPQVVRTIKSDGGTGLKVVRDESELPTDPLTHRYGFIAATDYLHPNIPLNVNGVVFPGGSVSLHGPSLQLIGIAGLTSMPLGYCGNDFARVKDLGSDTMGQLEAIALGAGRWLAAHGYVGAFGVDALESGGEVFLAEVNPRFQGSSSLSADLDRRMDRPDMYLENIAAFLGLNPLPYVPLAELAAEQADLAHVVPHNCWADAARIGDPAAFARNDSTWQLVPAAGVKVPRHAALGRAIFEGAVTDDGSQLVGDLSRSILEQCRSAYATGNAQGHQQDQS